MSGEIKDSGSRRVYQSGAQRDIQEGKGREDLLPMDIISYLYSFRRQHYSDLVINPLIEEELFFYIDKFMKENNTDCIYQLLLRFIQKEYNGSLETAIMELAVHYENGARKYSEFNWTKGLPTHSFMDSAIRHCLKYFRGDKDEPHERAFMWNLVGLLWTKLHKSELDDIFYGTDYSAEAVDNHADKVNSFKSENKKNESKVETKTVQVLDDPPVEVEVSIEEPNKDNIKDKKNYYLELLFDNPESSKKIFNMFNLTNKITTTIVNLEEYGKESKYNKEDIIIDTKSNSILIDLSKIENDHLDESLKDDNILTVYLTSPIKATIKGYKYRIEPKE